jgi:hypothetical protein
MIETIIEFIFNPYLLVNIGWMIILTGIAFRICEVWESK